MVERCKKETCRRTDCFPMEKPWRWKAYLAVPACYSEVSEGTSRYTIGLSSESLEQRCSTIGLSSEVWNKWLYEPLYNRVS